MTKNVIKRGKHETLGTNTVVGFCSVLEGLTLRLILRS